MSTLTLCVCAFIGGFLTDKLRVFPLIIGVLIGYALKYSLDTGGHASIDSIRTGIGNIFYDIVRDHPLEAKGD